MGFFVQERDTRTNMSLNSPAVPEQGLLLPPICIDRMFLTQISDHAAAELRLKSHLAVLLVVVGPARPRPTALLSPRSNG